MAPGSTPIEKVGTKLAEAIKIAKSVKVDHAKKFAHHVVPEVVRPARVLWNQAIGGVFLLLAVSFIGYAVAHRTNVPGMIGGIFLGTVMAAFGLSSFLAARRISRR